MKEEYLYIDKKTIQSLESMRLHFNGLVEAFEQLPDMETMRRVPIEDALTMIGITMESIMNELGDYNWEEIRRDEE
jgi:hypothetical protein|tara:strand:+ start:7168 stop:7395 length:228 start_codon:yes stop_codon:yes gene_type:complete